MASPLGGGRSLDYSVQLDISQAEATARQLQGVYERALRQIDVPLIERADIVRATGALDSFTGEFQRIERIAENVRRDVEAITREAGQARFTNLNQPSGGIGAAAGARAVAGGGGFRGGAALLAGGIAGYGATEITRLTFEQGQIGAQQKQLAESYNVLTAAIGLQADTLTGKLSAAVQETVTQQQLMQETNLLLVAAQDGQIQITEDQIATLAEFARLSATRLTANGRPLETEEAYRRLIQGIVKRETELLDELGLSTKQIADRLGVPLEEVNRSVEALLAGVLQVAEEDIEANGQPAIDEATRIEQAATSITDAWNRVREVLAEPVAVAIEGVAEAVEEAESTIQSSRLVLGLEVDDADVSSLISEKVAEYQQLLEEPTGPAVRFLPGPLRNALPDQNRTINEQAEAFAKLEQTLASYNQGVGATLPGLEQQRALLGEIAREAAASGVINTEQRATLDALSATYEAIGGAGGEYYDMLAILSPQQIETNEAVRAGAGAIFELVAAFQSGAISQAEFNAQMPALIGNLQALASAANAADGAVARAAERAASRPPSFGKDGLGGFNDQVAPGGAQTQTDDEFARIEKNAAFRADVADRARAAEEQAQADAQRAAEQAAAEQTRVAERAVSEAERRARESQSRQLGIWQEGVNAARDEMIAGADAIAEAGEVRAEQLQESADARREAGQASAEAFNDQADARREAGRIGAEALGDQADLVRKQADATTKALGKQADAVVKAANRQAEALTEAAEADMEAAAELAAAGSELRQAGQELEGALRNIEGLFGASAVTQEDLDLSEAGAYTEKADEYLRRLTDEVVNGVDREGVDIRDAAIRAGIDPNADASAILAQFRAMWEDSSLFAGGQNLDLINRDAVDAAIARQEASESGQQAILDFFGVQDFYDQADDKDAEADAKREEAEAKREEAADIREAAQEEAADIREQAAAVREAAQEEAEALREQASNAREAANKEAEALREQGAAAREAANKEAEALREQAATEREAAQAAADAQREQAQNYDPTPPAALTGEPTITEADIQQAVQQVLADQALLESQVATALGFVPGAQARQAQQQVVQAATTAGTLDASQAPAAAGQPATVDAAAQIELGPADGAVEDLLQALIDDAAGLDGDALAPVRDALYAGLSESFEAGDVPDEVAKNLLFAISKKLGTYQFDGQDNTALAEIGKGLAFSVVYGAGDITADDIPDSVPNAVLFAISEKLGTYQFDGQDTSAASEIGRHLGFTVALGAGDISADDIPDAVPESLLSAVYEKLSTFQFADGAVPALDDIGAGLGRQLVAAIQDAELPDEAALGLFLKLSEQLSNYQFPGVDDSAAAGIGRTLSAQILGAIDDIDLPPGVGEGLFERLLATLSSVQATDTEIPAVAAVGLSIGEQIYSAIGDAELPDDLMAGVVAAIGEQSLASENIVALQEIGTRQRNYVAAGFITPTSGAVDVAAPYIGDVGDQFVGSESVLSLLGIGSDNQAYVSAGFIAPIGGRAAMAAAWVSDLNTQFVSPEIVVSELGIGREISATIGAGFTGADISGLATTFAVNMTANFFSEAVVKQFSFIGTEIYRIIESRLGKAAEEGDLGGGLADTMTAQVTAKVTEELATSLAPTGGTTTGGGN